MKRILILAAAMAFASSADAADFPQYTKAPPIPQSAYSWTGFHVGGFGGYGISNESAGIAGANTVGNFLVGTGLVPNSGKTEARGGVVGVVAGYDYQFAPQWVAGIEADLAYANIKGNDGRTITTAPFGFNASLNTTVEQKLDWYGTVRGRLGYLLTPNVMLYGTGGLAYGEVKGSTTVTLATPIKGLNGSAIGTYDQTKIGYAAGGGVEWAVHPNVVLGAQYTYIDLGTHGYGANAVVLATPAGVNTSHKDDFHLATVKASYRF